MHEELDAKCAGCLFFNLCNGCRLPHCQGEDYVEIYTVSK